MSGRGTDPERFDTVIVGGGQAGLATGYHLARLGRSFVILDAGRRVGDPWRARWDSLRLFTPARYSGLPGWPLPGPRLSFPTKDEMADYLEAYAARFDLPVRRGIRVEAITRNADRLMITADDQRFEADNVVLATGGYQLPYRPDFADELDAARPADSPERLADLLDTLVDLAEQGLVPANPLTRRRHTCEVSQSEAVSRRFLKKRRHFRVGSQRP